LEGKFKEAGEEEGELGDGREGRCSESRKRRHIGKDNKNNNVYSLNVNCDSF